MNSRCVIRRCPKTPPPLISRGPQPEIILPDDYFETCEMPMEIETWERAESDETLFRGLFRFVIAGDDDYYDESEGEDGDEYNEEDDDDDGEYEGEKDDHGDDEECEEKDDGKEEENKGSKDD